MKSIRLIILSILLSGCTIENIFKPPPLYDHWYLPNADAEYPPHNDEAFYKYVYRREKDMIDCGIDPVDGESGYTTRNLCFERKGWRLERGMVCDDPINFNDPICIKWRAECQAGKMKKDIPCQEWRAKHGY